MPDEPAAAEFRVEDQPDPADLEILETQIRREASAAMGLGDEADLAIFVRDAGKVVAGISGWTWGDCCELQSLWVEPGLRGRGLATQLLAAAEAEAASRGCSQTVHFTYAFQARALYEQNGYELVGCVQDFPSGTDVLWYHKRLKVAGTVTASDRVLRRPVAPCCPQNRTWLRCAGSDGEERKTCAAARWRSCKQPVCSADAHGPGRAARERTPCRAACTFCAGRPGLAPASGPAACQNSCRASDLDRYPRRSCSLALSIWSWSGCSVVPELKRLTQ